MCKFLLPTLVLFLFAGCVDLNSTARGYPYGTYGSSHRYCDRYDRYGRCIDYDYRERERLEWERERAREEAREEIRRENRERRRRRRARERELREEYRERVTNTVQESEKIIRPSCPAGTVFTGRTCRITDSRLKKPGGDGNINPCPKGMWLSGDRCVK